MNTEISAAKSYIKNPTTRGRPKKVKPCAAPLGIVSEAFLDPENIIELQFYDIASFKSIFGLLKSYKVSNIDFCFTSTSIAIFNKDHNGVMTLSSIRCNTMNKYYFNETNNEVIYLQAAELSLRPVFDNINKDVSSVCITYNPTSSRLNFKFTTDEMSKDEIRSVLIHDITKRSNDYYYIANTVTELLTNYKIAFMLPKKELKNTVSDISSYSATFKISKKEDTKNLNFIFDKDHVNQCCTSYTNPEKINFKSKLEKGESIETVMQVLILKGITSSIPDTNVIIYLYDNQKSLIVSEIAEGVTIWVYA